MQNLNQFQINDLIRSLSITITIDSSRRSDDELDDLRHLNQLLELKNILLSEYIKISEL